MSKSRFTVHQLAIAGTVAALYAVLTCFSAFFNVAFGPVQCRFSEALCVLPFLFPETVPGLFVGCLIANLLSPYGALDLIFGSLATLLAALWTRRCRHKWTAPLPPVLCNAVIVGALIAFGETGASAAFPGIYAYNALTLGLGEAAACYVLGGILLTVLPKVKRQYNRTLS